jgi:SET domain-containing protein
MGQYGLFATKKIPPNTFILFYLGEVHADARETSDYDLSLFRGQGDISIGVDAQKMGNEARFVNDYRGVATKPNAIFKDARTEDGELRMGIWSATTEIKKGEEILLSYGRRWWKARADGASTS